MTHGIDVANLTVIAFNHETGERIDLNEWGPAIEDKDELQDFLIELFWGGAFNAKTLIALSIELDRS